MLFVVGSCFLNMDSPQPIDWFQPVGSLGVDLMSRAFMRLGRRVHDFPVDAADSDAQSCTDMPGPRTGPPGPDLARLQRPSSMPAVIRADDSWIRAMNAKTCKHILNEFESLVK